MMMRIISLFLFFVGAVMPGVEVQAFGTAPATSATRRVCFAPRTVSLKKTNAGVGIQQSPTQLWSQEGEDAAEDAVATTSTSTPPPPAVVVEEGTQYPVDLPSPILLATSMLLAIASTGMYMYSKRKSMHIQY
jgi:hypothetical protein